MFMNRPFRCVSWHWAKTFDQSIELIKAFENKSIYPDVVVLNQGIHQYRRDFNSTKESFLKLVATTEKIFEKKTVVCD
jgi:hypothetical protein